MPQVPTVEAESGPEIASGAGIQRHAAVSLRAVWLLLLRRWRLMAGIEAALVLGCLVYCLVTPNQYESRARVGLRNSPSEVSPGLMEGLVSSSAASQPLAVETAASILRGDQLAWRVISALKLYQEPGFRGRFASKFPGFQPDAPSPQAQTWLLERFAHRLSVQTVTRTALVEVRFRSGDPALSAAVVNALVIACRDLETATRSEAAAGSSQSLRAELARLKTQLDGQEQQLADFEQAHGIVSTPQTMPNGQPAQTEHSTAAMQIDELGRELATAVSERIVAEANYHAAAEGDPEMVIAADPRLQGDKGSFATGVLAQIGARRSQLEQERAQLSAEHGPKFPRVVEIGRELDDLDRQKKEQDAFLLDQFRGNWQTAQAREQTVRRSFDEAIAGGIQQNRAAAEYAVMRQQVNAGRDVYLKVLARAQETDLASGAHASPIVVVDAPRVSSRPVSPDLPLYLAITSFAGLWLAVGGAILADSIYSGLPRALVLLLVAAAALAAAQAPTPSTSGLPTGVAKLPQAEETRVIPNPLEASQPASGQRPEAAPGAMAAAAIPMPAPIVAGDVLDVRESHLPEFHSTVRVSPEGTVTLPLIGQVQVSGMDETAAARAIEASLAQNGMLLHPLVSVLVTVYIGQDVSVLGEVARPGVYPYTAHHRLLDLISAAAGLSPNAGRLVNVFPAADPKTAHAVVLDPAGADPSGDHNPELQPGDTVQVSRAGLVYVVGDVIRPGGFPVDPVQGLTVVQAISLAWGPTLNAAAANAVLIREQKGGRTITTLNLRRMMRGQDPDQNLNDRDILYVPSSMAKNLLNRTMESAIQSTVGVTIYSALVYSQRY